MVTCGDAVPREAPYTADGYHATVNMAGSVFGLVLRARAGLDLRRSHSYEVYEIEASAEA